MGRDARMATEREKREDGRAQRARQIKTHENKRKNESKKLLPPSQKRLAMRILVKRQRNHPFLRSPSDSTLKTGSINVFKLFLRFDRYIRQLRTRDSAPRKRRLRPIASLPDWTRPRACCCRCWAPLLLLLPWPTDTSPLDYVTTRSLLESRYLIIWWCTVSAVQLLAAAA